MACVMPSRRCWSPYLQSRVHADLLWLCTDRSRPQVRTLVAATGENEFYPPLKDFLGCVQVGMGPSTRSWCTRTSTGSRDCLCRHYRTPRR